MLRVYGLPPGNGNIEYRISYILFIIAMPEVGIGSSREHQRNEVSKQQCCSRVVKGLFATSRMRKAQKILCRIDF